jgi:hypothetical protein
MALRIDIEVDLIVRKVVEALLNSSNEDRRCTLDGLSSLGNPPGLPRVGHVTHANAGIVI